MKQADFHELEEENQEESDNEQIGTILSRRQILMLMGFTGTALLAACAASTTANTTTSTPVSTVAATATTAATATAAGEIIAESTAAIDSLACVVRPEVTEGPYYVDLDLIRSDVRTDSATGAVSEGVPFELTFAVMDVSDSACTPLAGATVEIWHCDALGVYSGVTDRSFSTVGQDFLRGAQITDADGMAKFTTIYPGWYQGRAVHIHFKVHPDENSVFTSQLFFDDALSDAVFSGAPYAAKGQRNTFNSNDGIYRAELLMNVGETADGYAATFSMGVDRSNLGSASGSGPGGFALGGLPPNGGPPPNNE